MIVDINAFVGEIPYWPTPFSGSERILSHLSQAGISHPLLLSTRGVFVNCLEGNLETLKIVAASSDTCSSSCTFSPMFSHVLEAEIEQAAKNGVRSIRLFPLNHSYSLKNSAFFEVLCPAASRFKWPIQIAYRLFMNWSLPTLSFGDILGLVRSYPNNLFIVSGPNYLRELEEIEQIMKVCDHCGLDISCVQHSEGIPRVIKQVGVERLFFGTGFPFQQAVPVLAKVENAAITSAEKAKILYENAVAAFRLAAPPPDRLARLRGGQE